MPGIKQEGNADGELGHAKANLATKVRQTVQELRNGSTEASERETDERSPSNAPKEGRIP